MVHGDEGGYETDTNTGDDTTDDEGSPLMGASLESDTGGEDESSDEYTTATAEGVSDGSTEESTCVDGLEPVYGIMSVR